MLGLVGILLLFTVGVRMSLADLATSLENVFSKRSEIAAAFVFGSVARETEGPLSDLDIAVLLDEASRLEESGYGYLAELTADIMKALHRNDVDAVILNTAPPLLKYRVFRDGTLLFCRSPNYLAEFRLRAFNEHQDWLPFLAVQKRYLSLRLKTGKFGTRDLVTGNG